jgi:hypothetical protein
MAQIPNLKVFLKPWPSVLRESLVGFTAPFDLGRTFEEDLLAQHYDQRWDRCRARWMTKQPGPALDAHDLQWLRYVAEMLSLARIRARSRVRVEILPTNPQPADDGQGTGEGKTTDENLGTPPDPGHLRGW